ncbi:cytochrome c oxidase accessory protein CcoG [Parvibium lacunae]|uniref:Cytochrome c oxidase accessory protein CcoG n=1 Tax=Parvibium lacunae TaxID=1888893 RepID=A0A368L4I5_9BURK|nr:cytochrome c oxidase accessory protein CcoG [Parvibium lacunae]RCS58070.1 cytochrome c oxidase accessory protein CcoG [Parvibium lacunae]
MPADDLSPAAGLDIDRQQAEATESQAAASHHPHTTIPLAQVAADLKEKTVAQRQRLQNERPTKAPSDRDTDLDLYEVRKKIYPRAVEGWFATWRWSLVWLTQLLYYGTPWLQWNGRQAVLFDLAERKFYIFGLILWPQDFIYLTILLILSAFGLFLFTAVAGRLFCGYACPQTVYAEIFLWIERKIEGERGARQKLDEAPFSAHKFRIKATKFSVWGLIALWTGFTFVSYFTPMQELLREAHSSNGNLRFGGWESFWMLFYAGFTFLQAGFMREQVCKYMCPYARFQSAMFDKDTMVITYDQGRGEPRGARNKKADPATLGLGSCVDCGICVQVCPTGIDIRQGLQYECIGCAACIDACDQVMDKMHYPRGLIRYSTENGIKHKWDKSQMLRRILRPRILIYSGILLIILGLTLSSLLLRDPFKVDIIRDRGSLGREVADGYIENVYRVQIMNTDEQPYQFQFTPHGLDHIEIVGEPQFTLAATETRMIAIKLRVPPHTGKPGANPIQLDIERIPLNDAATLTHAVVHEKAVFHIPR